MYNIRKQTIIRLNVFLRFIRIKCKYILTQNLDNKKTITTRKELYLHQVWLYKKE